MIKKTENTLTWVPAPDGTSYFWHVGCHPLQYLTFWESRDFLLRPAAYFCVS
ncbi:TPA: hypothetical protein G8C51_004516 [Salmonella enterica]|uniref:Uncharacterized protein n=1 Tax=Salmonella enterica TaxID=28901 RepID=A0A748PYS8_SALER|nr:hypothetical protein [Escherichia coli]HAF3372985.1 hypothetical protein [Salmonella enterica]EFI4019439.1 hypothetical protein [Escherichia coli]HAF3496724.1 hypothetical protein [Salmonella enterica]HAF3515556.1 hypothetical protein [Salmonella enterica]